MSSDSTTSSGEGATAPAPSRRSQHPGANRPSMGPAAPPPSPFSQLKHDLPASLVVFLVALPLCLGIAHASGAPLLSGILAGIVGGMVVSWASGSQLGVTGPAAGLTVIVLHGIESLGSFPAFCLATMIAGGFQIVLGLMQAGIVAYYFPSNVIKGLLAAIGAILILKQLPHAFGIDTDWMGDESLEQEDGRNTFTELVYALSHARPGSIVVAAVGLVVVVSMDRIKALARFRLLPAPLVAVLFGVGLNLLFGLVAPGLAIRTEDMVAIPTGGPVALLHDLTLPDFSRIGDGAVWTMALTIAAVASLETLLCAEAIDKLDPYKRVTPTNRELIAQGAGNAVSGLVGGLPMTAVIVRGSANIQGGGRTKMSAFLHGLWLLLAVVALPTVLNMIPLASLAAVLLYVGFNLTRPTLWKQMWKLGWDQFIPFAATVIAILATDLLRGVGIGLAIGVFFILRDNFRSPYFIHRRETESEEGMRPYVHIQLAEQVTFLNKAAVRQVLQEVPKGATVEIDGTGSKFIDRDVLEIIHDFKIEAKIRNVEVLTTELPDFVPTGGGH